MPFSSPYGDKIKYYKNFYKNNLQTGFHLIQELHETWDGNRLHTNKEFYKACDSFTANHQDLNSNSQLQRKVTFETKFSLPFVLHVIATQSLIDKIGSKFIHAFATQLLK